MNGEWRCRDERREGRKGEARERAREGERVKEVKDNKSEKNKKKRKINLKFEKKIQKPPKKPDTSGFCLQESGLTVNTHTTHTHTHTLRNTILRVSLQLGITSSNLINSTQLHPCLFSELQVKSSMILPLRSDTDTPRSTPPLLSVCRGLAHQACNAVNWCTPYLMFWAPAGEEKKLGTGMISVS